MPPTTNDHANSPADDRSDAALNETDVEQADVQYADADAPDGFDSAAGNATDSVDEIEAMRIELRQAQDRSLRLQAELENFRTRTRREMEEERRYALMPLIRDLLPALDNVARAIDAAQKEDDVAGLLDGFRMVAGQIETILSQYHCHRIEALDQPFDPHLHEAITQQPSDKHPPGTVMLVAQEGYEMGGRVVRPAQVVVSVTPPSD
jgi:molecular chaperone GrpE